MPGFEAEGTNRAFLAGVIRGPAHGAVRDRRPSHENDFPHLVRYHANESSAVGVRLVLVSGGPLGFVEGYPPVPTDVLVKDGATTCGGEKALGRRSPGRSGRGP